MSIFEIIMLICFGAAWPFSIYRSAKARSTKGKSLLFMLVVATGYVAGIANKLVYNFDGVVYLYVLDLVLDGHRVRPQPPPGAPRRGRCCAGRRGRRPARGARPSAPQAVRTVLGRRLERAAPRASARRHRGAAARVVEAA